MNTDNNKTIFSTLVLIAVIGLFCSTAIQVGFAINLHVPTVPTLISMTRAESIALPGLAARSWAAGTCLMFAIIGLLAIFDKFDRRMAHNLIGILLFATLLPIVFEYLNGTLPIGAGWIFAHHVIAGTLIFITRPRVSH